MKNKTLWIVVAVVVVAAAIAIPVYKHSGNKDQGDMMCTMEAKQCPDGSYVGRSGPKCEFSPCPTSTNGTVTTGINQTVLAGGISITPTEMVSDSRCPSDVKCIWAGNVNARVKLEKSGTTTVALFSIGTFKIVEGKKVTLTAVSPAKISTSTIKPAQYRFTFSVVDSK